jgi:hypothetical protein
MEPCWSTTGRRTKAVSCGITNPLDCISGAAKSVAGDAFDAIAHDFAQAADSTINWLWGQLSQATAVHLGGRAFELDIGIVAAITGVVAVGLFVIQMTASVLRRDPGGIGRAIKGLVVAFIAGGAAVAVTNLCLSAIDSLSAGVIQVAMGSTMDEMGHKLLAANAIMSVGNPAGMFLLAIVAIIATVIVWAALLIRKALIVVSAVFAPIAFAGSLADITVGWTRKWIEIMAALVVSKLVLVIVFIVGWGILDGAGQAGTGATQTITQTATGLLILALAGFAPWMALKLVHFGEDQFHRLHVLAGTTTTGARAAAAVPQKAAVWTATAASYGGASAAQAGGAAGGGAAAGGTTRPSSPGSSATFANGNGSAPASSPGTSGSGGKEAAPAGSSSPTPPASGGNGSGPPSATRPVQQPEPQPAN